VALTASRAPVEAIVVQLGWLSGFAAAIATLMFRSQLAGWFRAATGS
jgi:hypothetical protein